MRKNILLVSGGVVAFILVFGTVLGLAAVDKGTVGVVSTFGIVSNDVLEPGLHVVLPWKHVYRMNCQTQKNEEPATVPTKGGLAVKVNAVLLYKMKPSKAADIAREIGAFGFEERIIDPYFKNAVRDACAGYDPESLYNSDRQAVEAKVMQIVSKELDPRGF